MYIKTVPFWIVQGVIEEVVTFIIVVSPQTMMHVCYLEDEEADLAEVHAKMDSDVQVPTSPQSGFFTLLDYRCFANTQLTITFLTAC